jgi:hypothetical protein
MLRIDWMTSLRLHEPYGVTGHIIQGISRGPNTCPQTKKLLDLLRVDNFGAWGNPNGNPSPDCA